MPSIAKRPVPTTLVEAARAAVDAYDRYLKTYSETDDPLDARMEFARSMGHLEYHVGKAEQGEEG